MRLKSRGRLTQITAADTRDPAPRPRLRSESETVSDSAVCVRTEIVMYRYRLCPKSETLTEKCFQKMPLDFVNGSGTLRWDGPEGTTENTAWPYLTTGTHPPGSSWARNPSMSPRGCSRLSSSILHCTVPRLTDTMSVNTD